MGKKQQQKSSKKVNVSTSGGWTRLFVVVASILVVCGSVWLGIFSRDTKKPIAAPDKPKAAPKTEEKRDRKPEAKAVNSIRLLQKPIDQSESDYQIAREIAHADQLLEKRRNTEAIEKYSVLAETNSKSLRVQYGLALAFDQLAEERQSNEWLQKSIEAYTKIWNIADETSNKEILKHAMLRLADRQGFLGKSGAAVKTLQKLLSFIPDDVAVLNELSLQLLLAGQNDRAKTPLEKVLKLKPDDGFALGHYGFLLKLETKYEESLPYLYGGIRGDDDRCREGRFYFHLGDALQRLGRRDEAYEVYQEAADRGLLRSAWQRSLYNVDHLKSKPWWDPRETPYGESIRRLEKSWEVIRDEGLAVMDRSRGGFEFEDENLRESGEWLQFTLFQRGTENVDNCRRVPKTCELVRKITEAAKCSRGQVKYSVMHPGTHIWPHTGPTNCRLRMHLGLVIPDGVKIRCGNDTKVWEEGKMIILDDSFEHEVWHNGSSFRLIFIIDVWHPDITEHEKQTLPPI